MGLLQTAIRPKATPPKARRGRKPRAPTALDPLRVAACVADLKPFVIAGRPGIAALSRIWLQILKTHGVSLGFQRHVLLHAGLKLYNGRLQALHATAEPEP
jgi:hypothetical protein